MRYSYTYNNTGTKENLLFSKNETIAKPEGSKFFYLLSDHLGNVRVLISDMKLWVDGNSNSAPDGGEFTTSVLAYNNFTAYGSPEPARSYNPTDYRRGFNGKEKDDEIKGSGNSYDFGARISDPRLGGRFLSIDRFAAKRADISPYAFAGDCPISAIDKNGDSIYYIGLNSDFIGGWKTVLKTPSGRDLILHYAQSTTEDVYITVNEHDLPDRNASTYPSDATSSIIKDGKVDIYSKDAKLNTKGFEQMQSLDVSKSAGKKVSFISMDAADLKKRGPFRSAGTIFHEFSAHIKHAVLGMTMSKPRWNKEHKDNGSKDSWEKPEKGSDTDKFNKDLEKLIK